MHPAADVRGRRLRLLTAAVALGLLAGGAVPPAAAQNVHVTKDLVVPVSDGSYLLGDLYRSSANLSARLR
jgi:ABC-type sugar transport system substrate-binding protein